MANDGTQLPARRRDGHTDPAAPSRVPQPTAAFRRRAWLQFQRSIDPLAPPKPLRIERH